MGGWKNYFFGQKKSKTNTAIVNENVSILSLLGAVILMGLPGYAKKMLIESLFQLEIEVSIDFLL